MQVKCLFVLYNFIRTTKVFFFKQIRTRFIINYVAVISFKCVIILFGHVRTYVYTSTCIRICKARLNSMNASKRVLYKCGLILIIIIVYLIVIHTRYFVFEVDVRVCQVMYLI